MPYKDREKQKESSRRHYLKNKDKILARQRLVQPERKKSAVEKRRELALWLDSLKEGQACVDCGIVYPTWACDYHHIDPSTKILNITAMVSALYSKKKILEEIEKCVYVCAICHRGRHYDPNWVNHIA